MSTILTIDDFDPLFVYSDYTAWETPNPQDHPTWWNASQAETGSIWHQATYHYTTQVGTTVSLNFTGSGITLLGAGGPSGTNYTVTLDPTSAQPFTQSYTTPNATDGRTVLFNTDGLSAGKHTLEIENLGSGLLVDLAVINLDLGTPGAELTNTTVQNDDPKIQYSGDWTTQNGPNFSGGTSTYTSGQKSSFNFSFQGSALYIYGDQVNDHGYYSIYLNGTDAEHLYGRYTGRSGCGGGYAKSCEKLHGLVGFAGGLPEGKHQVTLVNESPSESGGNVTFFDFDYLEYTVPSQYLFTSNTSATASCPFANCTSSTTSPSAGSGPSISTHSSSGTISASAAASSSGGAGMSMGDGMGLLGLTVGAWVLRKVLG
ncbi:hypothetical protein DB88DRAFT_537969 [Papiliotrema laurentii]|uniref:Uncharacterized protein n=1 Tax=Papiliotrema laurentii TaxID=5418 RepID=A0AAD9FTW1_PAPLA|nr:hypothetical protein DB88DRAFT_537969 [Papiliotrema laurentii]